MDAGQYSSRLDDVAKDVTAMQDQLDIAMKSAIFGTIDQTREFYMARDIHKAIFELGQMLTEFNEK